MSGAADRMKGRAKETLGEVTDDRDLRNEGRVDQGAGTIKDKVADAKDWVERKVDQAKGKAGER